MIKVGILGATGYTALELIKILLRHPQVEITRVTSRSDEEVQIEQCHPALHGLLDLPLVPFGVHDFESNVDVAFSCLPHAAASPIVSQLLARKLKVVDFSADYRLNDIETYNQWYQSPHTNEERVGQTPYGLPELFRSQIKGSDLVANPGCFPTSVILPLAPLLKASAVAEDDIVVDAKTGISGAGRKPKQKFHFPECNDSVTAYGLGTHRHAPEMDQILERFCGSTTQVVFSPHLMPMTRGILSTIYLRGCEGHDADSIRQILQTFYENEPFVRIVEEVPATANVANSNFCDIWVGSNRGRTLIVSAIDNLVKGASGAAVQNFNLMNGFPETMGLL